MYIKYYVFKQFVIPVNAVKMNIKAQKIGTVYLQEVEVSPKIII